MLRILSSGPCVGLSMSTTSSKSGELRATSVDRYRNVRHASLDAGGRNTGFVDKALSGDDVDDPSG